MFCFYAVQTGRREMSYGTVIAKKLANALFADAEANDSVPSVVSGELHRFKQRQGGLWVGGTATLTDTHVLFSANALNDAAHKQSHGWAIPLSAIKTIEVEFGWLTKIIAITAGGETYRLRCFGAKEFAEKIKKQAGLS